LDLSHTTELKTETITNLIRIVNPTRRVQKSLNQPPKSPNLGEVGQFRNCPYGDTPFDWAHDRPRPPAL